MNNQVNIKKLLIIGIIVVLFIGLVFGGLFLRKSKEDTREYFLELFGENDIVIYQGSEYIEPGYRAYDNKGIDYNNDVQVFGNVNTGVVGEYVLTYKYQDFVLERRITVLAKSNQLTFLILNGDKVIYLKKGEEYVEPGFNVIDSVDVNLNDKVEVSGSVDTNKPGTYKIIYSVTNARGVVVLEERTVIVESKYHLELNGDSSVNHLLGNKYVDLGCSVYDERGDKVNVQVSIEGDVNVNKEGIYTLKYILDYEGYNEIIERKVQVYKVSCNGTVNRYGTTLTVSGNGIGGQGTFAWNIDGKNQSGDSKITLSYKKIKKASVGINTNGLKGRVNCNINNKLVYQFVYDSGNTKPFIKCNSYNANDRSRLENILKQAVSEAGYGTRAGVVEAARFLVGGLEYKIPYLGPKSHDSRLGRYNQVGLNIANNTGWGCSFSDWTQGIDCTNFVAWAFIQAGLKVNGVYSTTNVYKIKDVVDRLQVGDLLLTPGEDREFTHVGIIIGIDSSSIYVAEATTGNINAVVTTRMDKNNLPTSGNFSKARLYEYQENGNVTNMWVD